MSLEVKGFIESSFLDWDGKVVSTLYLGGCNFRCPFCHNSGLVEEPHKLETISPAHIEKYIAERKDFIDGICLTGGEPCLHKERGLFEFLKRIKGEGFEVKFDSNGLDPDCLNDLIGQKLVDYIAMDIKAPLDERYNTLSGTAADLEKIKKSIDLIMGCGIPYEFRTTVVPTMLDKKDIEDIARSISGARRFVLQKFVPDHALDRNLRKLKPYTKEEMREMAEAARVFVPNTIVRGA